ncbi:hypothetical protein E3N88_15510 [Mikania micrantha]|uniref:DUF4219 domain-containing protein n=1 Tax=Mikania micrantha TaxID=192012 RepID=A0A5N6NVL5_9ASTR|nr:hypothetical protein E3N88_15510 [Mikania micrantha]
MVETKDKEVITSKEGGTPMSFQCPMLNSTNYTIWAVKIRSIFNVHGIWEADEPKTGIEVDEKKNNAAIALLYQAIPENIVRHVGVERVKEARLQSLESDFESLKMGVYESIDVYAGKINEIASQASNLGHTMNDKRLVRKLLDSVPPKFIQIEQFADLNTLPFQEAVGGLKAFEEHTKKQIKEDDMHDKLLFTKGDGKEKVIEHKCERCGHENSNQDNKGCGRGKIGSLGITKKGIASNKVKITSNSSRVMDLDTSNMNVQNGKRRKKQTLFDKRMISQRYYDGKSNLKE